MKSFLILFIGLFSFTAFSQEQENKLGLSYDEDKLWEQAKFEVKQNELQAYTTDLDIMDMTVTYEMLLEIKEKIYSKDGVFKIESLEEGKLLRIYHMEYIEIETIKQFVIPLVPTFHPNERVPYYIN